jgi:hypothetical protein
MIVPPGLVRTLGEVLRGADIGESRATNIAADVTKIIEAVDGARALLDFNDEPARFDALLLASTPAKPPRRK